MCRPSTSFPPVFTVTEYVPSGLSGRVITRRSAVAETTSAFLPLMVTSFCAGSVAKPLPEIIAVSPEEAALGITDMSFRRPMPAVVLSSSSEHPVKPAQHSSRAASIYNVFFICFQKEFKVRRQLPSMRLLRGAPLRRSDGFLSGIHRLSGDG